MKLTVDIKLCINGFVMLKLLFNGELISGPCGITVRESEISAFIMAIGGKKVDVLVDRENVTSVLLDRLAVFNPHNY